MSCFKATELYRFLCTVAALHGGADLQVVEPLVAVRQRVQGGGRAGVWTLEPAARGKRTVVLKQR
jgi:hypothetical protein